LRTEYLKDGLEPQDLDADPHVALASWIEQARAAGSFEPTAMCLSTATPAGVPSARIVLLRIERGDELQFFTNYLSQKGLELDAHPHVCGCLWWPELIRQVRIEGIAERLSAEDSDRYFHSRPLESRIASCASPQSREIPSREFLEREFEEIERQFPGGPPRPESWGGYRINAHRFEFWQGRPARLHDRIVYTLEENIWKRTRLAP